MPKGKVLHYGRGSELNNGVVILDVLKTGKTRQLYRNQGAPGCITLESGNIDRAASTFTKT